MEVYEKYAHLDRTKSRVRARRIIRWEAEFMADLWRTRELVGMSQEEVAAVTGRDIEWVRWMETRNTDPKMSDIMTYAHAVGAEL